MLMHRRQNKRKLPQVDVPPRQWHKPNWLQVLAGLVVADVVALLVWGGMRMTDPDAMPVRTVKVTGEFRRAQAERLQAAVTEQVGGGFFALDVSAIRAAIMADPWVQDVTVRRVWPDQIDLRVTERHAVARWGRDGLLTADGELFKPSKTTFPEGLVNLDGPSGSERQVLQRLADLRQLVAGVNGEVTQLVLNPRRSWSFTLANGTKVSVGRTDFDARVQRFADLYNELVVTTPSHIEEFDLRYTNGFAISIDTHATNKNG